MWLRTWTFKSTSASLLMTQSLHKIKVYINWQILKSVHAIHNVGTPYNAMKCETNPGNCSPSAQVSIKVVHDVDGRSAKLHSSSYMKSKPCAIFWHKPLVLETPPSLPFTVKVLFVPFPFDSVFYRGANPTRWQNLQFSKFDRKILKLAGRFLENVSNA